MAIPNVMWSVGSTDRIRHHQSRRPFDGHFKRTDLLSSATVLLLQCQPSTRCAWTSCARSAKSCACCVSLDRDVRQGVPLLIRTHAHCDLLDPRDNARTARRIAIEKKIALREATAAEFSAVAQQSYTLKWKRARAAAVSAKARNDEFIQTLHATQQRALEAVVRHKSDLTASSALLEREKARYLQKIEAVYPAWQERQQAARLQTLRVLEEKKRAVEKRRHLAKKVALFLSFWLTRLLVACEDRARTSMTRPCARADRPRRSRRSGRLTISFGRR